MKIRLVAVKWIFADGRTDITEVSATYCNYSNVSKQITRKKKYVIMRSVMNMQDSCFFQEYKT